MKRKIESVTLFFRNGKNKKGVDIYGYTKVYVSKKKELFSEMAILGKAKGLDWHNDNDVVIEPNFVKEHRWFKETSITEK